MESKWRQNVADLQLVGTDIEMIADELTSLFYIAKRHEGGGTQGRRVGISYSLAGLQTITNIGAFIGIGPFPYGRIVEPDH